MKNNYIFGILGVILFLLSFFHVWDLYLINIVCIVIFGVTFLLIIKNRKNNLFYKIVKYILSIVCLVLFGYFVFYLIKYYFYLDTILPLLNIFLQILIVINVILFFIKKNKSGLLINVIGYIILYNVIIMSFILDKDFVYYYFTSSYFYMIVTLMIMFINSILEYKKTA